MTDLFSLNVDNDGIAYVAFDAPDETLNTLSSKALDALDKVIADLSHRHDVKAMILASHKEGCFVAGADLKEINKTFSHPEQAEKLIQKGHAVLDRIAALPFPTIALINGICVGGGTELALAFTYRVATDHPKTAIALPEVTLGIMPGWGGTQRSIRLIGLRNGMTMVLSGKHYKPKDAFKVHLVDAVVPWPFAREEAIAFAHDILTDSGRKQVLKRRKLPWLSTLLMEGNPLGRKLLFYLAEKGIFKKTKGQYTAPFAAIRTLRETAVMPLDKGLQREREIFTESMTGAFLQAPNLVGLFFAQEAVKKDSGASGSVTAKTINSAGVLGAGTMGSGIAWLISYKDIPVRFKEADWERVGKGYGAIHDTYDLYVRKLRKLKPDAANLKFHRVSGAVDFSGLSGADLIIEAALEDSEFKKGLLADVEGHVPLDAIIATNTSSLPVSDLATALKRPERFIGIHFFNPVPRMPLVEVIPGEQTSQQTIATAVAFCKKLDKVPIVVKDVPGFLVNRILMPGVIEGMHMLQEGVDMERLDKVMADFGMPMGPFLLADEIGNDVIYKVGMILENAYGERMQVPGLAKAMNDEGLFGKKVGKGFYLHKGKQPKPNGRVKRLLKKLTEEKEAVSDLFILERSLFAMVNEASRCLEEGVVANPTYLDLALVMGTGFPPFRGGLLRYADSVGIPHIVSQLQLFSKSYGNRFVPCETLLEMQRTGATFYSY